MLLRTSYDEGHFIGVVRLVLGADLTEVPTVVRGPDVLDDEAPLARALTEVDAQSRVGDELEEADGERVYPLLTPPRHLL